MQRVEGCGEVRCGLSPLGVDAARKTGAAKSNKVARDAVSGSAAVLTKSGKLNGHQITGQEDFVRTPKYFVEENHTDPRREVVLSYGSHRVFLLLHQ